LPDHPPTGDGPKTSLSAGQMRLEPGEPTTAVVHSSTLISRSPVFYGWIILLVGSLGLVMTGPGQTYSLSIFVDHFINDIGISRSGLSTLFTVGTIVGSFALPIVGQQIDLHGSRVMVAVVAGLFGLACIYMSFVQNAVMLGLGFIAIRALGQGSLTVVSRNAINQWWIRRRGMALGISGILLALIGTGGIPKLIFWLNAGYGWRFTFVVLGLILLLGLTPLALIFLRDRPEKYGLLPDSNHVSKAGVGAVPATEVNWTLAEATRTPAFWVATLGLASISLLSNGLSFHMISIFGDKGLSVEIAVSVFLPIAIAGAVVALSSSVLAAWIPVHLQLTAGLFFQALALGLARSLSNAELAMLYGVTLGVTMGLQRSVNGLIWATYFGRKHLGKITGYSMIILIVGSALGPLPLGIGRDLAGDYNAVLAISAVVPIILSVVSLFVHSPRK
jgi:MFS transporter, OFA family, oxalate/formate antiporter